MHTCCWYTAQLKSIRMHQSLIKGSRNCCYNYKLIKPWGRGNLECNIGYIYTWLNYLALRFYNIQIRFTVGRTSHSTWTPLLHPSRILGNHSSEHNNWEGCHAKHIHHTQQMGSCTFPHRFALVSFLYNMTELYTSTFTSTHVHNILEKTYTP